MAYMTAQQAKLRPDQRAALEGLRSAALGGAAGFELQDAERNMVDENEREARNALTTISTPADRRQHLQMAPGGDVYMPNASTMQRIGHSAVFGGTPGDIFQGHASAAGISQPFDTGWAGFHGHFADKDRMRKAVPNLMRGLGSARGDY
jgi:hypothetical protein